LGAFARRAVELRRVKFDEQFLMRKTMKYCKAVAILISAITLAAAPVHAQWSGSVYGTAEFDTNNTNLLFAGMSLSPGGGDIAPIFGLQAYRLSYKSGSGTTSVFVVKPSAGLRFHLAPGTSANLSLGYAFANKDVPGTALSSSADRGDGVVLSGGLDLTPSTSPVSWQALASYNFGSDSFWGRVRAPIKLRSSTSGSVSIAPEVAYLSGTGYSAVQPGAVVLWQANSGFGFGAGIAFNMPNQGDNSTVFKVEASHPLF
jgi:hypothetical protein